MATTEIASVEEWLSIEELKVEFESDDQESQPLLSYMEPRLEAIAHIQQAMQPRINKQNQ